MPSFWLATSAYAVTAAPVVELSPADTRPGRSGGSDAEGADTAQ